MNRKQRHLGRELTLQWLFQMDIGGLDPDEVMTNIPDDVEEFQGLQDEGREFAEQLTNGILVERRRIDEIIARYATGWSLERMASVERNVLRIALFEILGMPDVPTSVSVDEAVELAKQYGSEDSGKFVNGILGAFIRTELSGPETA